MPLFSSQRSVNGVFSARKKAGGILPYLTRQVITTGFVAGGYKDSVAWQNVNSFAFSTETTTGRGNLLTHAGGYIGGCMNRTYSYTIGSSGTGSSGMAASGGVNKWNHKTYAMVTTQTAPATMGDPEAAIQYDLLGTGTFAWVQTNTANMNKLDMTTYTWPSSISTGLSTGGSGVSCYWTETDAIFWADTTATAAADGQRKFNFATVTESNPGISISSFGNQKGVPGKTGYGWAGNEGSYNGGFSMRRYNYTTNSTSVQGSKPVANSGEENYFTGQAIGVTLGTYTDAGQVLNSGKYTYATETGALLPSSEWYRGTQSGTGSSSGSAIAGASSGAGTWSD
jgi:hypothetical protein